MRVIVTRSFPQAEATAARLRALGHEPIVAPLFVEEALNEPWPAGTFSAYAVTSATAARHLSGRADRLAGPIFAVGAATAEALEAADIQVAGVGPSDGRALAALLLRSGVNGRVLHLCGDDPAPGLGAALGQAGVETVTHALYAMRPVDALPASAHAALAGPPGCVLHYSPRAGEAFVTLVDRAICHEAAMRWRHICLSEASASPLRAAGFPAIAVASAPNEAELLRIIGN